MRHNISDREPCKARHAAEAWMVNLRGSRFRGVTWLGLFGMGACEFKLKGFVGELFQLLGTGRTIATPVGFYSSTSPRAALTIGTGL